VPPDRTVYLAHAGLASLWCLSYAAFHTMDVASVKQREPRASERSETDIGAQMAALRTKEHVDYAAALFHRNDDWPEDLPLPRVDAHPMSPEGRINNVFFGALSWIVLHEIAHVHHRDLKLVPKDIRIRQEYLADNFATRWILDEAGKGLNREFRILMIAVALAWLFVNERTVGQGTLHPPAINRFKAAVAEF
jgi:hypothetical protein